MGFWSRVLGLPDLQDASSDGAKAVYGTTEFVRTLDEGWFPNAYGALYRRQPAVRASVDWLARNIAQLNPKVYERISNSDRLEVGDHPLAILLRRPNPVTTRYALLRDTVADIAVYDRAVWVKEYRAGRLVAVNRRPPTAFSRENIDGRVVYTDANGSAYRRNQLVLFNGYSPDGDELGVSPMETLRRVLAEERLAQQHRENMWRNSARQSGWIERPIEAPNWSSEARDRFRNDLESVMTGGANAGRVGILEEGMRWNGTSFSPKDTEYIDGRKLTYEEVCVAYGLKPGLLGLGQDTAASSESSHRHAYQDVLGPWLRMMQDEIELQLLPDYEPFTTPGAVYVEFNLAEKLKGSFEEQAKAITTAVGVPHLSVNEGRAKQNLPRIDEEWADLPVRPLNVMYGGQPAATVPTEVPEPKSIGMKAAAADPEHRETAAEAHRALLRKFFERQERVVLTERNGKAKRTPSKWDDELRTDLFILAQQVTSTVGLHTANQIRGRYDADRVTAYLADNAERTAKTVNEHTLAAVEEAEDLDGVRQVFEEAKTSRTDQLAVGLATLLVNFARTEAGLHSSSDSRRVQKTWVVTNPKSRHPEMNGQKVPVDGTFSNGARWPGDPALGADGAAHCQCLLEIGD